MKGGKKRKTRKRKGIGGEKKKQNIENDVATMRLNDITRMRYPI
jgi:hypothetical protein